VGGGGADINGDALHASLGLPPALTVDTARVGKLQITVNAPPLASIFFFLSHISVSCLILYLI
jgi:hypothetical protein